MEAKQFKTGMDAILDPGSFGPVELVDFVAPVIARLWM
jgi:hypothetical protein